MEQKKSKIVLAGRTDVGCVRDHNEDNFHIASDIAGENWTFNTEDIEVGEKGCLLMVADGMGGTNAGEVASEMAVNSVIQAFKKMKAVPKSDRQILDFLQKALVQASADIVAHASKNTSCEGMGTTAVLAWIVNHQVYVAWSGDSRLYKTSREGDLQCITRDHSLVWEMVMQGHMSPEEARTHPESNIITQNLGDPFRKPEPDTAVFPLRQGDRILLCSDGLNGELPDEAIDQMLKLENNPSEIAVALIEAAKSAGGHDNITVLVVEVIEAPESAPQENVTRKVTKRKGGFFKWIIIVLALLAMAVGGYTVLRKGYFAADDWEPQPQQRKTPQSENIPTAPASREISHEGEASTAKKPSSKEKTTEKARQQKKELPPVIPAETEAKVVESQREEVILRQYEDRLLAYETKIDSLRAILIHHRADDRYFQKLQGMVYQLANFKSYLHTVNNNLLTGEQADSLTQQSYQLEQSLDTLNQALSQDNRLKNQDTVEITTETKEPRVVLKKRKP